MIYALTLSWHATRHSSNGLSSCVMTFCLLNLWGVGDAQQQLAAQSRGYNWFKSGYFGASLLAFVVESI